MFIRDIQKVRSKSYLFTIKPMREEDDIFLAGAKKIVKGLNKEIRSEAKAKGRLPKVQYRLSFTPGQPLPRFRWKYEGQPGGKRKIKLEDAATVDVYVHRKNLA
jgi:hypothetical protein